MPTCASSRPRPAFLDAAVRVAMLVLDSAITPRLRFVRPRSPGHRAIKGLGSYGTDPRNEKRTDVAYGQTTLPSDIPSRFVSNNNGITMHMLEAVFGRGSARRSAPGWHPTGNDPK